MASKAIEGSSADEVIGEVDREIAKRWRVDVFRRVEELPDELEKEEDGG